MDKDVRDGVACRLVVDGKVIEFVLPGPLVAMPKKPRKGAK